MNCKNKLNECKKILFGNLIIFFSFRNLFKLNLKKIVLKPTFNSLFCTKVIEFLKIKCIPKEVDKFYKKYDDAFHTVKIL